MNEHTRRHIATPAATPSMSTLVEVVTQGSISNALTGVKRPLQGNPTSVPSQLPAFRGVPNTPGNAIKAPKLSAGNRSDRGTNVLTPVARVTALTSIGINNGRLSPGDVAFVRRTPGGYARANYGPSYHGQSAGVGHMTDMFGVDGVNRFLSGTLNGARVWKLGDNLIDTNTTAIDDATNLFGIDPATTKPYLSCLREYRLDGVVLSNEEPYSFMPTGERDATVFNIGIKGAAPVNNGFMTYDAHSPTEMYARGADPMAYGETMRIGSERAGDTWHGKIGYDFVAAYTSVYTEYPLQMFGRDVQPLDTVYLLLRKLNLEDDVVAPRVKALVEGTVLRIVGGKPTVVPEYLNDGAARAAVLASMVVKGVNGSRVDLTATTADGRRGMVFFQYMPCSSRAFVKYHQTLRLVDAALSPADKVRFAGLNLLYAEDDSKNGAKGMYALGRRDNYARKGDLRDLLQARRDAYLTGAYQKDRMHTHDTVRFLDILMCAGAWKVGTVIDTRSARATPYANGPTNASYRMTVVMDPEWLARNKSISVDTTVNPATALQAVVAAGRAVRRPPAYWAGKGRGYAETGSKERAVLSTMAVQTLSERELYEAPLLLGLASSLTSAIASQPTPTPTAAAQKQQGTTVVTAAKQLDTTIQAKTQSGTSLTAAQIVAAKGAATAALGVATAADGVFSDPAQTDATVIGRALSSAQNARDALEALGNSIDTPDKTLGTFKAMFDAAVAWANNPDDTAAKTTYKSAEAAFDAQLQAELDALAAAGGIDTSSLALAMDRMQRRIAMSKAITDARANARVAASAPLTAAVTAAASTAKKAPGKQPAARAAAPPPGVDSAPLTPAPAPPAKPARPTGAPSANAPSSSSLVDATIAASRNSAAPSAAPVPTPVASTAAATSAPPTAARSQGVVDSVFDTIFGAQATPTASARSPLASPSSPTPSSGSETGPRAYSRRNR
jgi:3-keto-L-gulonate-6-phosphate decarboxylase